MRIRIVLWAVVGLMSCSTTSDRQSSVEKSPVIRKVSKLVAPKRNTTFRFGESIDFEVETRDGSTIDSIRLEFPAENASFSTSAFTWSPQSPRAGSPRIRLVVYMGDVQESLYPKVRLLPTTAPKEYSYRLINTFPHDDNAWTQGLLIHEDTLFEGTGRKGQSVLRKLDLKTGKIYQELKLEDEYFGEGIAIYDDKIFQLTWQEQEAFIYDRNFNRLQTFPYPTEGWGITNYGDQLVASDGSEKLYILDPGSLAEMDRLEVYDTNGAIDQLNELEMIDGLIYANVWFEEFIVMIDPSSGAVVGKLDLSGLLDDNIKKDPDVVLNGIAYDEKSGHLIVTGKLYPLLFEIELLEKPSL